MIGLYLVAIILPAVRMEEGLVRPNFGPIPRDLPGGAALVLACPSLPWWANVLFGIGIICFGTQRYRSATVFGWGAVALASLTWIAVYADQQERLIGETDVQHLLVGAYIWMGTFLALALCSMWFTRIERLQYARLRQVGENRSWDGKTLHLDDEPVDPHVTDRKEFDGTQAL
jgi:hypothetical protein